MLNDTNLKASALAELRWDPSVTAAHIGVTADGAIVRLSGTVHSLHERSVATVTAWAAPGVIEVENHLTVV